MKISWTPTARKTYFEVLDHLDRNWTIKEVENFISEAEHSLEQIKSNPEMFQVLQKLLTDIDAGWFNIQRPVRQ